jgi:hypothetical protein
MRQIITEWLEERRNNGRETREEIAKIKTIRTIGGRIGAWIERVS